ncbi:hypothetical protein Tco_0837247 [Tanacetum coccineum]
MKTTSSLDGAPPSYQSDRGTTFAMTNLQKSLLKYGVSSSHPPHITRRNKWASLRCSKSWFKASLLKDTNTKPTTGLSSIQIFDIQTAGDHRKDQLNELNELRDQGLRELSDQQKYTKRIHMLRHKPRFQRSGDRVPPLQF